MFHYTDEHVLCKMQNSIFDNTVSSRDWAAAAKSWFSVLKFSDFSSADKLWMETCWHLFIVFLLCVWNNLQFGTLFFIL